MRSAGIVAALLLLAGLAVAQDGIVGPSARAEDLFSVAKADRSLARFAAAVQSSGMAKMLREERPLTVFALSNRAFANLDKKDRQTLLSNNNAMNFLLAHYIVHGSVLYGDKSELRDVMTLAGTRLRIASHGPRAYANGGEIPVSETHCTNGNIYVIDDFDPGLIRDAVALVRPSLRDPQEHFGIVTR
jgi:uncharacterized surface protein with fasciclin (FAS1) repeats